MQTEMAVMNKSYFFALAIMPCWFILFFLYCLPIFAATPEADPAGDWVKMPAGAKPAYMGIHGGTMPVSLLVSGDGSSLLAFVGRTGNDFLEALREAKLPLPSFGNSTKTQSHAMPLAKAQTGLFAGNATTSLPVISISGDFFARQAWLDELKPFGFSTTPLSIEGQATKPERTTLQKRAKLLFQAGTFQLKRN